MKQLYRLRGLRAIAHSIRRRFLVDEVVHIEDFDGDLAFECHLNEHIGSHIYWFGSYSTGQLRVLDRILRDGMTFIDVGANQGEFTLAAAKRLPHGKVVAFEPMTAMFQRLERNVAANGLSNVTSVQMGLWSEPATKEIFWSGSQYSDSSFNEGLGTLYESPDRHVRVESVDCVDLDGFLAAHGIDRVDLMKIDVEGAELEVLRGASHVLERHAPILIVEADRGATVATGHDLEDLLAFLNRYYTLELIQRSGRTVPFVSGNLTGHHNLLCRPL